MMVCMTSTAFGQLLHGRRQVYELAEYCINQGGITHLHEIKKPDHDDGDLQ